MFSIYAVVQKFFVSSLLLLFLSPVLYFIIPSLKFDSSYSVPAELFGEYIINTLTLVVGVGLFIFLFGVGSACAIAFLRFPGRKFVEYMLFLPLAIPPYISTFAYSYIFGFSGPICTFLREKFGFCFSFHIQSIWGVIFIMSVSFYPYVYMLTLARVTSAGSFIAVARTCGKSFWQSMKQVVIPVARPAIVAGIVLVLLEVVSDFGVAQFLGVQTFTTGIYRAWFLLHDEISASRLVLILLSFIAFCTFLEKRSRQSINYTNISSNINSSCWTLTKKKGIFCFFILVLLPFFGLILPVFSLFLLSFESYFDYKIITLVANTIKLATVSALLTVFMASVFVYLSRRKKIFGSMFELSTLGYAVPGIVIGISIMKFLNNGVNVIEYVAQLFFMNSARIILMGSFFALLYSYVLRFLALGANTLQSGVESIPKEVWWNLKLVGKSGFISTLGVCLPIMLRHLIFGLILVFIDTMKELSATLVVRPFNFDTISTRVYELVMDERYGDAAIPSILIVSLGFCCIILLTKILYNNSLHNKRKSVKMGCLCNVCLCDKNECYN